MAPATSSAVSRATLKPPFTLVPLDRLAKPLRQRGTNAKTEALPGLPSISILEGFPIAAKHVPRESRGSPAVQVSLFPVARKSRATARPRTKPRRGEVIRQVSAAPHCTWDLAYDNFDYRLRRWLNRILAQRFSALGPQHTPYRNSRRVLRTRRWAYRHGSTDRDRTTSSTHGRRSRRRHSAYTQAFFSALSNTRSMTTIFATESSIGVGTAVSSRIAKENRSPWIVY